MAFFFMSKVLKRKEFLFIQPLSFLFLFFSYLLIPYFLFNFLTVHMLFIFLLFCWFKLFFVGLLCKGCELVNDSYTRTFQRNLLTFLLLACVYCWMKPTFGAPISFQTHASCFWWRTAYCSFVCIKRNTWLSIGQSRCRV